MYFASGEPWEILSATFGKCVLKKIWAQESPVEPHEYMTGLAAFITNIIYCNFLLKSPE